MQSYENDMMLNYNKVAPVEKSLLSFFLKERLLFCWSVSLLKTRRSTNKKTFRFHTATGDFTTILYSLIMSLGSIIEENRKENNMNTETLPSMWCPCICNSKNSSNSRKSFSKDFLERFRNEANLLKWLGSHSLGNIRLNFFPLTFTFIMDHFCALSITRYITAETVQDGLSSWFLQENPVWQSQSITSKWL